MFLFYLNLEQFAELVCGMGPRHRKEAGVLSEDCHHESLCRQTKAFYFFFLSPVLVAFLSCSRLVPCFFPQISRWV